MSKETKGILFNSASGIICTCLPSSFKQLNVTPIDANCGVAEIIFKNYIIFVLKKSVTYHININKSNIKEFLQIASSLISLGVIESFESNKKLVKEGEPIDEDTLLDILEFSKQEIKDGQSVSMEEIENQIEAWKKR